LSQQAVAQDVAAKILCDNLQALTSKVAHEDADLPESVRIYHAFAHTVLKPLLPGLLLAKKVGKMLREVQTPQPVKLTSQFFNRKAFDEQLVLDPQQDPPRTRCLRKP
jgi:hypothetical protein